MTSLRRVAALAVVVCVFGIAPSVAFGSPETLKRSVSNITMAPLDLALSPVLAGITLVRNLRDEDDSLGVRLAYPIPGFVFLTMVQTGAAVIRLVTGLFEFVPGVFLLPFEADIDPLFDPADENEALVDYDLVVYYLRFGINYTTPAY